MTTKTRRDGEGTVYREKATGDWIAAMPSPVKDANGRRKVTRARRKTEAQAWAALKEMGKRATAGRPLRDSKITVGAALTTYIANGCPGRNAKRATTIGTYATLAKSQIRPYLGGIGLDQLRPSHLDRWMAELVDAGFAASTRRQALTVLRAALDYAVRDGVIGANPAHQIARPSLPRKEAGHYTAEELGRLLAAAQEHRHRELLVVLAGTALRRGEVLALRWSDVSDTELRVRGTLVRIDGQGLVVNEPKTRTGWRTVPLSPAVAAAIAAQRTRQKRDRLAAGPSWIGSDFVFTTEAGTALEPRNVSRWFTKLAEAAGVGGSPHTLRHSSLTAMLAAGVPLTTVSRIAGHSSVSITGDIYGHVGDESARAAVEAAAGGLGLA